MAESKSSISVADCPIALESQKARRKAKKAKYRVAHRAELRAKQKAYYAVHKAEYRVYNAQYRAAHKAERSANVKEQRLQRLALDLCTSCGCQKEEDGLARCKSCREKKKHVPSRTKTQRAAQYAKHKIKIRARIKAKRKSMSDEERKACAVKSSFHAKRWKASHKQQVALSGRLYREKNKEKEKARWKRYKTEYPDRVKES